jgi:acetyl esterase/lipase
MEISRRSLIAGAALTWSAAGCTKAALAADIDPLSLVDPELLSVARAMGGSRINAATLRDVRATPDVPALPPPALQPEFRTIPGPKGAPDVRVMMIDGSGRQTGKPVYLHMHGGGFVTGRLTRNPGAQQMLAQQAGCLLVSVDYRLAPETRFPGALEDNYAALRWLHANADALGIDRKRIAIGGDSAGGGHAAMLAIAARDRGEFPIAFQLLVFPMLDDRTGSTVMPPHHVGTIGWNAASNRFGWASLLGQAPGLASVPAGSVPARERDLAGLPPTFIAVGGLDLFVAEDIAYAERLNAAADSVELLVVPGAFHAFQVVVPEARVSRQFKAAIVAALRRGLAT